MKTNLTIRIPVWLDRIVTWPLIWHRKKKYGDSFRKIPLGQGLFAIVSPKDFYWLNNFRWCAKGNKKRVYAVRFDVNTDNGKTIAMHRQIMNAPKGILVDHKNRNPLDNRRNNIRFATPAQNMCNRRKRKIPLHNTSAFISTIVSADGSPKFSSMAKEYGSAVSTPKLRPHAPMTAPL